MTSKETIHLFVWIRLHTLTITSSCKSRASTCVLFCSAYRCTHYQKFSNEMKPVEGLDGRYRLIHFSQRSKGKEGEASTSIPGRGKDQDGRIDTGLLQL